MDCDRVAPLPWLPIQYLFAMAIVQIDLRPSIWESSDVPVDSLRETITFQRVLPQQRPRVVLSFLFIAVEKKRNRRVRPPSFPLDPPLPPENSGEPST